jgi:S-adenosylmethionine synthetase
MRPRAIVERFGLKNPIFSPTAAYGHMGRDAYRGKVEVEYMEVKEEGEVKTTYIKREKKEVDFFGWEKLDYADKIKQAFSL